MDHAFPATVPLAPPVAGVASLARGLAVLEAFRDRRDGMTLADCARATGLDRAVARRMLHTLQTLGYARSDGRVFMLTPRVLSLAGAFLSSSTFEGRLRPLLEDVSAVLSECCAAAVLDGDDVVYMARAVAPGGLRRVLTLELGPGTRLPAYASSLGRVLVAALPEACREAYLARLPPAGTGTPPAPTPTRLRAILRSARQDGHAVVDGELEPGVICAAVPVLGPDGRACAAIGASAHARKRTVAELRRQFLPVLREAADRAGIALA